MTSIPRGPLLVTGVLAAVGGAAIPATAVPILWQLSLSYGALFTVLVLATWGGAVLLAAVPTRRRAAWIAAITALLPVTWVLDRILSALPDPDPWLPTDSVLGITDTLSAVLLGVAVVVFGVLAARSPRRHRRLVAWIGAAPLTVTTVVLGVVGVITATAGPGLPPALQPLRPDTHSTVEYCRPNGIPLPMDLYTPAALGSAPVAVYVHGGGFLLGSGQPDGLGAVLANSPGALFEPLRQRLTAAGFVVAAVDYRLAPASPWPGPIVDVKCAIRFLKANATTLGIDPDRIGIWGSSAGGTLAALVGTTSTNSGLNAGFDSGQYLDQNSTVQAVVDMFGPTDLTDFAAANGFMRMTLHLALGCSTETLRTASPSTYLQPGTPPFLILHGTNDALVAQSAQFATRLRNVGVPVTYIPVRGAGHELNSPGQHPSPGELTTTVIEFLTRNLPVRPMPSQLHP